MSQKIIRIGSSAGVTLPKDILQGAGLEVGDGVTLRLDDDKKTVVMTFGTKKPDVDPELVSWTKKFIDTYRCALDELARN